MKYIGIKKIWYGNVFTAAPVVGAASVTNSLAEWLAAATTHEVKNSHDGTWGYTQDDPTTEDYTNELTGKLYHRDITAAGNKTITWTMGEYDYADKVALQGGTEITTGSGASETSVGWKSGSVNFVSKGIVALTKSGNYVVFTNANITAKVDQQQKALGLGVTAVAQENETAGVEDEYWFTGSSIIVSNS